MTEKQENILNAALELFAKEGYRSTSTSKVAKKAGVSEGLIFRHYTNKEGLLQAIMEQGEQRAKLLFADIVMESDPKEVIRKTFNIGKFISDNHAEAKFWKLQYKIKWELEEYSAHKMEPLQNALIRAFEKLNTENPLHEANNLLIILDGLATRLFLDKDFDILSQIEFYQNKYNL